MILGLCFQKLTETYLIAERAMNLTSEDSSTMSSFSVEERARVDSASASSVLRATAGSLRQDWSADVTETARTLALLDLPFVRKYQHLHLSSIFQENCKVKFLDR